MMSESTETVWITKYALTKGILRAEGRVSRISTSIFLFGPDSFFGEGDQWHRTREAAIARAEEMRKAKIASHEKSIEKLRKLSFA